MSTIAPIEDTREASTETFALHTGHAAADAAALLDHNTRSRAVRPELAGPGHYLELAGAHGALLVALGREVTRLGRGIAADVRLEDQRVSRHHAIVALRGGSAVLLDDRSQAGTFLNGERISEAELRDGDELSLGPVTLRYVEVVREPDRRRTAAALAARGRLAQRAMDGWVSSKLRSRSRPRPVPGAPAVRC